MKPNLLLLSHGQMAQETLNSAEMIAGRIENVTVVSMAADDGLSGTLSKVKAAVDVNVPTIALADLLGGTPCNSVVNVAADKPNLKVMTGLNLGMVIDYALSTETDIDKLMMELRDTGVQGVQIVADDLVDLDDLDE